MQHNLAYQNLLDMGLSMEEIARKMGFQQTWRVRERLDILRLHPTYQRYLVDKRLTPSQSTFGLELSMDEAAVGQRCDRLIERLVGFVRSSFNPRDLEILPRVVTSSLDVNIKQLDLIAGELLKIKKALIQAQAARDAAGKEAA